MAPKDQARNTRGQFVRQDKEITVTAKEATATVFAAAALAHMADNPNLYHSDWGTGAKTNKAAILSLANKVQNIGEEQSGNESPAEVLHRLNLDQTPATPTRKRAATTISLLEVDDESDERVYKAAPKFKRETDNPFASPAKMAKSTTVSEKANPAVMATVYEDKEYLKDVAVFMSKFGDVVNVDFDSGCPAYANSVAGRPVTRDATLRVNNQNIQVAFLRDKYTTGCLIPCVAVNGLIKAVDQIHRADPDNLTDKVPVSFVLHAVLRMNRDFGVVKLRKNNQNQVVKDATIAAWEAKYLGSIMPDYLDTLYHRVAGLVDYVKNHGIVKCHALTDHDVDMITGGIDEQTVEEFWGHGNGGVRAAGSAGEID